MPIVHCVQSTVVVTIVLSLSVPPACGGVFVLYGPGGSADSARSPPHTRELRAKTGGVGVQALQSTRGSHGSVSV